MPVHLYALARLHLAYDRAAEHRSILSIVTRIERTVSCIFEQSDRNLVDRDAAGFDPHLPLHFVHSVPLSSPDLCRHYKLHSEAVQLVQRCRTHARHKGHEEMFA